MSVCEICNWITIEAEKICEKCGFFLHTHSHYSYIREVNGSKERYLTRYPFIDKIIYNKYGCIHIKGKNHIKPKYHEL